MPLLIKNSINITLLLRKQKCLTFVMGSLFMLFFPINSALAAEIYIKAPTQELFTGSDILIQVYLNPEDQSLNAIEGKIKFPKDILSIKEINDGDSTINFWLEKPLERSAGIINFSGFTAGGNINPKAPLFSIIFHINSNGTGAVTFSDLRSLINDGNGSEANIKNKVFNFNANENNNPFLPVVLPDNTPPELFNPVVSTSTGLYAGKNFLAFSTQDKDSGVDHYEIKEGNWGQFVVAESPYILKYQDLNVPIYVKAVDRNGNERLAVVQPINVTNGYQNYVIIAIIIMCLCLVFLLRKKMR